MRTFVCLVLVLATVLARQEERVEVEEEVERKEEVEEAEEVSLSPGTTTEVAGLVMVRGLRNITRDAGGSLKLRCEVEGAPPATSFRWFKFNAPVLVERGRVRVKTELRASPQWSMFKISELETLDTAFYRCEATNGASTVHSEASVRVNLGSLGTIPRSFPPPETGGFPGGPPNMPTNIQFEGRSPPAEQETHLSESMLKKLEEGNPSLVPNEASGFCQPYYGSVCGKYIGANHIYISEGLSQEHIEKKLAGVLPVISESPDMSDECREFALPSICLSTFAICDTKTQKPRKICRDECEILEHKVCKTELAIARNYHLLGHQMVLPDCEALPPVGSRESTNCVKLGFPLGERLIQPHSCYQGRGEEYRGTAATTRAGYSCVPWSHHQEEDTMMEHLELVGGHNYCRNPEPETEAEPWCFTNDDLVERQVCGLQRCAVFNMWLYVAVPSISAIAILGLSIGLCCMRRRTPPAKPLIMPAGSLSRNFGGVQQSQTANSTMEMGPLLTARQQQQKSKARAMELPLSSIRFLQELGEGAFGKVYKGELTGFGPTGLASLVAIKTLKPGAATKTRQDFVRESELMTDLRHPNIVCLVGVCLQVGDCLFLLLPLLLFFYLLILLLLLLPLLLLP